MFTNTRSNMTHSFAFVSHMLGLCFNTYVDTVNEEHYKLHRSKASTMVLRNMSVPKTGFNMPIDKCMPVLETNDNEHVPSIIVQALEVTPL